MRTAIDAAMAELGAVKNDAGVWSFNDAPINVKFLIRNDGDGTRLSMGEYISQQMEALGFQVERKLGKSSELSPDWMGSDPLAGTWNV